MTDESEDSLQNALKASLTVTELKLLLELKSEYAAKWKRRSCSNCKSELSEGVNSSDVTNFCVLPYAFLDDITVSLLQCKVCNKCDALWLGSDWCSIDNVLKDADTYQLKFSRAESSIDHLRMFLLSQVCHNQQDLELSAGESPFLPPNPSDLSTLIWKDNHAIGFYTIKQKGTAYPGYPMSHFALSMVDAIYIRRLWRQIGIGTSALSEIFSKYPNEDVGFSDPVSNSLLRVLCNYLSTFPHLRDRLWVCRFTGEPGYRWNVYLRMKKKILNAKVRKQTEHSHHVP